MRLLLPAVPADVALARQALAGLTDDLGVDAARAADLRTAITHACADAAARSGGADTPLDVAMAIEHGHLVLTVGLAAPQPEPHAIALQLTPGGHVAPVLGRVVSLVAARADFSIDRLSDAQIVSDAIAGSAVAHARDGVLCVGIHEHEGGFELVIGPLVPDGGRRLLADAQLPGLGCLLARLTDRLIVEEVTEAGGGELLRAGLHVRPRLRMVPSE